MPTQKHLVVVSVADVDAEERVDYSLVETWKLKLEVDDLNLNFGEDIEAEVWSRFSSRVLVEPGLRFGQDFEGDIWSRFQTELLYESSTPTSMELNSSIFQSL